MKALDYIHIDKIRTYVDSLVQSGLSITDISHRLNAILQFLEWAYYKDKINYSHYQQLKDEIDNISSSTLAESLSDASNTTNEQSKIVTEVSAVIPSSFSSSVNRFFSKFRTNNDTNVSLLDNTSPSQQFTRPYVYISFAFMILVLSIVGYGIYDRFFKSTTSTLAYPSAPLIASRILSFQGRLTDSLGNPITASTNMKFRLYDAASSGTTLYDSGTCSIAPDQDGIHNVLIGSDCGAGIASSVFTENTDVWLGVTVGSDSEMTPRQRIANVPYAMNSETLQGLPLGRTSSTVPYINDGGDLLIAASSPQVGSTYASQTFVVSSAQALTLQSAGTGDVTLTATGSGEIKFLVGGASAGVINNSGSWGVKSTNPANFELQVNGDVGPETDSAFDLGTDLIRWRTIYADNLVGATITPGFTTGSVVFSDSSGNLAQDNASFFWDDTANKLGIGTAAPVAKLHTTGAVVGKALAIFDETGDQNIIAASASGVTVATLARTGTLTLNGDLAVNGDDITADGSLTIGATGGNINLQADNDSDDYLYISTDSNAPQLFWEGFTSNDPGIRVNTVSNEVEYRDEDESGWTSLDSLASGALIWTDGGSYVYPSSGEVLGNSTSAGANKITGIYLGDTSPLYIGADNDVNFSFSGSELAVTTGNNDINFDSNTLFIDGSANAVGIGTATPTSKLHVTGAVVGKALAIFDETGDQNIITASASGVTVAYLDRSGNLSLEGAINDISGNLVLNDVVDIGSATTGLNVTTAGVLSDIDGTTVNINDNLDASGTLTAGTGDAFTVDASGNITTSGDAAINGGDLTSSATTFNFDIGNTGTLNFRDGTNSLVAIKDQGVYGFLNLAGKTDTGDPASCAEGDIYYNDTDDTIKICHETNTWEALDGGVVSTQWTDSGTTVYLTDTTDEVVIGGSTPLSSAKFSIDGDADQIQALIQAHSSQTTNILELETSAAANLLTVDNSGNLSIEGAINDISGNLSLLDNTDITGNLTVSGTTQLGDAGADTVTSNAAAWTFASDTTVALTGGLNGLNFDSNTLSIDAANDKIGIGTAAPVAKLHTTGAVVGKALAIFDETGDQDILVGSASGSTRFRVSNDGTIYGGYLLDISNTAYGIDPAATGNFGGYSLKITGGALLAYDEGTVGIGDQTPDAKLNILATTEQLRLDYDDSNYASFTTGSGGDLTVDLTGGQLVLGNADTINIGGVTNLAYNAISDSGTTGHGLASDDDLYVEGDVEVDGSFWADGTLTAGDIVCTDCLDFTEFADSMSVDATTDINLGTSNLTVDLDSSGIFDIRDGATTFVSFDDDSTIDVTFPAAGTLGIDAAATDNTTTAGVINLDVDTATDGNIGQSIDYQVVDAAGNVTGYGQKIDVTVDTDAGQSHTVNGSYIGLIANDATSTTYGLHIVGEDAGGQVATAGILIENLQATDIDLTTGILIRATTDGSLPTAIDVSDNEITTALSVGANTIAGTTGLIDYTNFDVDASGNTTIAGTTGLTFSSTGGVNLAGGVLIDSSDGVDINDNLEIAGGTVSLTANGDVIDWGSDGAADPSTSSVGWKTKFYGDGYGLGVAGSTLWAVSDDTFKLYDNDTTTYNLKTTIGTNADTYFQLYDDSLNEDIRFHTNGTSWFNGGGLVIGATATSARFQVVGDESRFGTAGTVDIATGDGDVYIQDALEVDGTITASDISCTDCLDFTEFADSMSVDATTDINLGTSNLTVDLDSSGIFDIRDGTTTFVSFDDDSTIDVTFPVAGTLGIDAAAADNTTTAGVINLDVDTATDGNIGSSIDYQVVDAAGNLTTYAEKIDVTVDTDAGQSHTVNGSYIGLIANDATSTTYGLHIVGEDAGGQVATAGILIENLQATDIDLTTGVLIRATTDGSLPTAIDVSDNEITTALAFGANNIDGTSFDVTGSSGDITTAGNLAVNGGSVTSTSSLTLDAVTDIILDADGADVFFKDATVTFATFTNSSTDLTLDIAGGQLVFADGDVFNIGAVSALAYNAISDSGTTSHSLASDDDLYVEGDVEVDGTLFADGAITAVGTITGADFACTDCLDFAEFEDTLDLDAALTLNQSTNDWTQNYSGTTSTGYTYNANSISSGTAMAINSTSTAFSSGTLLSLDWSPGSLVTNADDLFKINTTTNGNMSGYYINLLKNSGSVFSIAQSGDTITAGDVAINGDDITSDGDLTITPSGGDIFVASNILPTADDTYNLGSDGKRWKDLYLGGETMHIGTSTSDEATLEYTTSSNKFTLSNNYGDTLFTTSSDGFDFVLGEGAGDDFTVDTSTLVVESDNNRVGIGTDTPDAKLHLTGANIGKALAIFNETGDQNIFVASSSGSPVFVMTHNGDMSKGDSVGVNGIGDSATMVPNGSFEVSMEASHTKLADSWAVRVGAVAMTTDSKHGDYAVILRSQNDEGVSTCIPMAGDGSRTYIGSVWAKGSSAINNAFRAGIYTYASLANCTAHASVVNTIPFANITNATSSYAGYGGNGGITVSSSVRWGKAFILNNDGDNDDIYIDGFLLNPTSNTTGLDLAETYPAASTDNIQMGEIVSMGTGEKQDEADINNVKRSDSTYDNLAFGIVATKPGVVLDDDKSYEKVNVALKGRVPVLVTTENGPIHIGDPITTSSIPGVGMKATRSGKIVGYAMTEWTHPDPHEVDQVTVFVNPETYVDLSILTDMQNTIKNIPTALTSASIIASQATVAILQAASITTENFVAQAIHATTATIDTLVVDTIVGRQATLTDAQITNLNAQALKAQAIETETLKAGTLEAHDATISGTLVADNIDSTNIRELRDRLERIASEQSDTVINSDELNHEVAEIQNYITELTNTPTPAGVADTETYQIVNDDISIDPEVQENAFGQQIPTATLDSLTVTGTSSMTSLTVADAFSAGEVFIQGNSVISLVSELKLNALDSINIMNGAVMIAKDGTITAKGEVIAEKGVRTNTIRPLDSGTDVSVMLNDQETADPFGAQPSPSAFKVQTENGTDVASIDTDGSARFNNLTLSTYSEATSSAVVIAARDNYRQNGLYAPAIQTNAAASGNGILPYGENDIVIYNSKIKRGSIVNLTPTASTDNQSLYIDKVEACLDESDELCRPYFRVALDNTINSDVTFNWLLVN